MIKVNAARRLLVATKSAHIIEAERRSEYVQRLKDMGIKHLGKGAWSDVFQHPTLPDVVVKVSTWTPGFAAYAKFCQTHSGNPYLLKVADVHEKDLGEGFNYEGDAGDKPGRLGRTSSSIIFVEKLTEAPKQKLLEFVAYCEKLADLKASAKTFDYYHDYENENLNLRLWKGLAAQSKDRNLQQFSTWYVSRVQNNHIPDIHDSNVMMRGPQIVFSDPLS